MKMKHLTIIFFLFLVNICFAQSEKTTFSLKDSTLFDFWVGEWDLTWKNADGSIGKGTNRIEKTLDGKVIQENFRDVKGFKGTSLSVFNPQKFTWHQAWADNGGGYFNFIGDIDGEKRIFKTQPRESNGKTVILRMVFYDIKPESLTWDWERSDDGGQTWNLSWRINYKRRRS
jgi:hypothetical protein